MSCVNVILIVQNLDEFAYLAKGSCPSVALHSQWPYGNRVPWAHLQGRVELLMNLPHYPVFAYLVTIIIYYSSFPALLMINYQHIQVVLLTY